MGDSYLAEFAKKDYFGVQRKKATAQKCDKNILTMYYQFAKIRKGSYLIVRNNFFRAIRRN